MEKVTLGRYRLTEKRESVWTRNKTMLHFHRLHSEGLLEDVKHVKSDTSSSNGDIIIPCENSHTLSQFELGAVYELIFEKQEP